MPATIHLCPYCQAAYPQLEVSDNAYQAVLAALASKTLAAAELQYYAQCTLTEASAWVHHLTRCIFSWPTALADQAILQQVEAAFQEVPRPEHFTDYTHCPECAGHDATLCANTRSTLTLQNLGVGGWDPITFSNPQGIGYFFPTLARYALLPEFSKPGSYCEPLLSHLAREGGNNAFLHWCTAPQRQAVYALLRHLEATRPIIAGDPHLETALQFWQELAAPETSG